MDVTTQCKDVSSPLCQVLGTFVVRKEIINTRLVGFTCFSLFLALACVSGCEVAGRAVEAGGEGARSIVGSIEPTGMVQDTAERKELTKSLRTLVDSINTEALNRAVAEASTAATLFRERVEAIPTQDLQATATELSKTATSLRTQVEGANLDETAASLRNATDAAGEQLSSLDSESINATVRELRVTIGRLGDAVERLQTDASTTLSRVSELSETLNDAVQDAPIGPLARNLNETASQLKSTTGRLPDTVAAIDSAIDSIRLTSKIAAGVLLVLGACLILWLLRLLRLQAS